MVFRSNVYTWTNENMQKCSFFNLTFVVVTLIFFLSFYLTSFGSRKDIIKLNERIVVFNAIQKTGSTSIGWLFKTLSRKLKFSFKRYSCQTFNASRQKSPVEQDRFRARVRRSKRPSMTVQEIHFVAFPVDAAAHPGYVTFLRDPVERFKSRYQWSRANPKTAKIQFRAQKFYEPIQVRNLSFGEWLNRDLESCVMNEDAACNMNEGETVDHPLVTFTLYSGFRNYRMRNHGFSDMYIFLKVPNWNVKSKGLFCNRKLLYYNEPACLIIYTQQSPVNKSFYDLNKRLGRLSGGILSSAISIKCPEKRCLILTGALLTGSHCTNYFIGSLTYAAKGMNAWVSDREPRCKRPNTTSKISTSWSAPWRDFGNLWSWWRESCLDSPKESLGYIAPKSLKVSLYVVHLFA